MTQAELDSLLKRVAGEVSRNYPPVEAEDVWQELALWLLENPKVLTEYPDGVIAYLVRGEAIRYCQYERVLALHGTDQYHYTPSEVRDLLVTFFDQLDWDTYRAHGLAQDDHPGKGGGTAPGQSIYHGDNKAGMAMLADVSRGLGLIGRARADTLAAYYGEPGERDGSVSHRKFVSRVVDALVAAMNDDRNERAENHEGPGSRHAVSNNTAINSTHSEGRL